MDDANFIGNVPIFLRFCIVNGSLKAENEQKRATLVIEFNCNCCYETFFGIVTKIIRNAFELKQILQFADRLETAAIFARNSVFFSIENVWFSENRLQRNWCNWNVQANATHFQLLKTIIKMIKTRPRLTPFLYVLRCELFIQFNSLFYLLFFPFNMSLCVCAFCIVWTKLRFDLVLFLNNTDSVYIRQ